MAELHDANSLEYDPNASIPLLESDSLVLRIYQRLEVEEWFQCNYELNPAFQRIIEATGLRVTGLEENVETRTVELPHNYFFLATNYQPQLTSEEGKPHPLIIAYSKAVLSFPHP